MRYLPLLPLAPIVAVLLLSACSSTGGFVSPMQATKAERCAAYEAVLLAAEAGEVAPDLAARAKAFVSVYCQAEPMPRPAE